MKTNGKMTNNKISISQRLGYGSGQVAIEIVFSTVGVYFLYFLTDIAMLGAAIAGTVIMLGKAWDGITDIGMGYICDHTKTRWGQHRPYVLFGAIPMGVFFFLLFQVPGFSETGKIVYYSIMLLMLWTAFTICGIPYYAMIPTITRDSYERTKLVGTMRMFGIFTMILIVSGLKPLVGLLGGGSESQGYANVALLYGTIIVIICLIVFFSVRERYTAPQEMTYKIKDTLGLIIKNKPFLIITLVVFLEFCVFTIASATLIYFFKYVIPAEQFIPVAFLLIYGIGALAIPFWVRASKKLAQKHIYQIGFAIYGLGYLLLFFFNTFNFITFIPMFMLSGIGFAAVITCYLSIVPETLDWAELNLGVRSEGIQYGFFKFIYKIAGSFSSFVLGMALAGSGYAANTKLGPDAIFTIRLMMTLVPAVLCLLAIITLVFYPITREGHQKILAELEKLRGKAC
jgi:GPH family glycoside/pentoside/hexuronide:cation symporter